jgi:hypothetical protein
MLEFIILMTIAGVAAIAASIHYMHKAGIDILDIHKGTR